jgi:hypothetical protein
MTDERYEHSSACGNGAAPGCWLCVVRGLGFCRALRLWHVEIMDAFGCRVVCRNPVGLNKYV